MDGIRILVEGYREVPVTMSLHALLQGSLFSLSLCFDLGIVNVAIMKTGIERGFKPSFMIGFGSCFGDLLYMSLALLGVSVIFEIGWVKWPLWAVGSVFLTYLSVKMAREAWRPKPLSADGAQAKNRSLLRDWASGLGLAVASPTVIAWFALAAGPILAGMNIARGEGMLMFTAGFFIAGLVWSAAVAAISSLSGTMFQGPMIRLFSIGSAMLFCYFAVKVFVSGLRDLLA
jgi:L-lysine exporter family protein LysE/ArgO